MVWCLQILGRTTHAFDTDGDKTFVSLILLGRDKERYVRSLAENVEGHLNANDLRPAYRALKKLRSKSPSWASAIRTADGRLVSDMDGQMARWAEYFGQLFTVDPPTEKLHTTGLQAVDADPPIDESAPSLDEVREGIPSKTNHPLHLMVAEGWKKIRLVADGRYISLKWTGKNDEADLFAQILDFPVNMMSARITFSCSGYSPEWNVGDGQNATVPLYPMINEQQLVVTGEASSMPYLITDSNPITIVTNTTLTVKIQRQNSTSVVKIVQEKEELLLMQESLRPVITVGSKGGNTRLRLSLSDPNEEQENSHGPHPKNKTLTNMQIAVIVVFACKSLKRSLCQITEMKPHVEWNECLFLIYFFNFVRFCSVFLLCLWNLCCFHLRTVMVAHLPWRCRQNTV
ncbi:hypothetical protein GWK47_015061 [Chionoecetes opilio]|uniref:Uncharacterized protein n=1 Tax=Chionoecetes opilio TaxID=41210 RepID=A0A8J4XVM4_CHIOP|nr:hypothetical protein GWK47_015061 [Chionoecetes opilio]